MSEFGKTLSKRKRSAYEGPDGGKTQPIIEQEDQKWISTALLKTENIYEWKQ